jgi:redox-sensitive bicupin YhaK (pirin superfamily)
MYKGFKGVAPRHIRATLYDVTVRKGRSIPLDADPAQTAFVFTIEGDALVSGRRIQEKSAVLFGEGDWIQVAAPGDGDARFIFFLGPPLHESIAWGGPIVMNTREELDLAFRQLREGAFLNRQN